MFVLSCVFSFQSYSEESQYKLSLQSSLLFTLNESYDLKKSEKRQAQAFYSVEEAKAGYYPDIQLSVEAGREYNNPAVFNSSSREGGLSNGSFDINLTLRQMLFDPAVVKEVVRRRELENSSNVESNIVLEDVIEETVEAYIDVWRYQNSVVAAAQALVEMRKIHDRLQIAYETGGESKMQYDYVRARLALAESQYQSIVSSYRDAINVLSSLTGPLPDFIAEQPDELMIRDYDVNFYKMLAAKKNNELQLIDSNIRTAQADIEKQETKFLPTIDFVVEGGRSHDSGGRTGAVNDASAMIQLTYDIFKGGERKATEKRLLNRVEELRLEKEDIAKDVTKNVKSLYNEITGAENSLSAKFNELDSYFSLRDISEASMKAGEVNYLESIENEENVFLTFSEIYSMQADIYKKSYSMLKLIGALKKNKFCESC